MKRVKAALCLLLTISILMGLVACADFGPLPEIPTSSKSTATEPQDSTEIPPRLVDRADLLDEAEEGALLKQLDEISQRQEMDVVVVTVNSLDGKTPQNYADDFFDDNGYGYGENRDGILLLVSMEQRDWYISTSGYGITAFTDAGIAYFSDCVVPKLGKAQYADAFDDFAQKCDIFITMARNGEPYAGEPPVSSALPIGLGQ